MQDLSAKLRLALTVYRDRGRAALQALERQDTEEFFRLMSSRDAAFHNFRALDVLAARAGIDAAADAGVRQLWVEVDQVNRTLRGRMTEAQASLGERLARLRVGRARTQAYHSGTPAALRLVKQV
jgi:hypothetical protein